MLLVTRLLMIMILTMMLVTDEIDSVEDNECSLTISIDQTRLSDPARKKWLAKFLGD